MPKKLSYFDLQAEMGVTKHPGGAKTTEEMVKLCQITKNKRVLDVGCGVGNTACYLAKKHGCKVTGVDLNRKMIVWAEEKARSQGLRDKVEFLVADALNLPFKNNSFDAVLSESVLAFVDKEKAVKELKRVLKPKGFLGLNETTWLKQPSPEISQWSYRVMNGIKPASRLEWQQLLVKAGLKNVTAQAFKIKLSSALDEVKLIGLTEAFKRGAHTFKLIFTRPAVRQALIQLTKDVLKMPKNFMKHYGYGLYTGQK